MTAQVLTRRQSLNRTWGRLAGFAVLTGLAALGKAALNWERSWYVTFNWTDSLPHWAYVVDEGADPIVGDYVDFWPPENKYYEGISFVKQIKAGPGDLIICEGRRFVLDGVTIAIAKEVSQGGDPLSLGPCGVVPPGHYFVTTPHKDSFDSRYREIGYVPRQNVRGVARPVL